MKLFHFVLNFVFEPVVSVDNFKLYINLCSLAATLKQLPMRPLKIIPPTLYNEKNEDLAVKLQMAFTFFPCGLITFTLSHTKKTNSTLFSLRMEKERDGEGQKGFKF
jgi:hypothetical protein